MEKREVIAELRIRKFNVMYLCNVRAAQESELDFHESKFSCTIVHSYHIFPLDVVGVN